MCGINGIVAFGEALRYREKVAVMNQSLSHRGPDGEGLWNDEQVVLGHRRLAIIDLSEAGHQPMISADGKQVLVFNGEIYNFNELRQELKDYPFRSKTDTEVILAAYARWGIECVEHFNGMFAFGLWDQTKQELMLVRDRLGEKPLYYYSGQGLFMFSSEIRAMMATNIVPRNIAYNSLVDYFRYQTVHAPNTILENVHLLMPGEWMKIGIKEQKEGSIQIARGYYWKPGIKTSALSPEGKSNATIENDIHSLLSKSVERRLVADVPFGAFLSGGIDSTAIVGLMSQRMSQPVNTFSVVFGEKEYSESPYSQMIAKQYTTCHQEIHLKPNDFLNMIPDALSSMDHPSGDGPNTWVVSKVTKNAGISMVLSGLGGDELFAGYDLFKRLYYLEKYRILGKVAFGNRKLISKMIDWKGTSMMLFKTKELLNLPDWRLSHTYPIMRNILSDDKICRLLNASDLPTNEVSRIVTERLKNDMPGNEHLLSEISKAELSTYLVNILLRDTDQMSMSHALEVRVPFLDHELVEYVLQVNDHTKYPHTPKQLLVKSLQEMIPAKVVHRKKMGFSFPWDVWMRNELKGFCEENLHILRSFHMINEAYLDELWNRFLNRDPLVTWSRIWHLVVLGYWMKKNGIS